MSDRDLRGWIDQLDSAGELARVSARVDWRDEVAAITRKTLNGHGPALLFEKIADYEESWCRRLFVNGLGSARHVALMFNQPTNTPRRELVSLFREALNNPIDPEIVSTGAVKENVRTGSDIDLLDLPVPHWHPLDGGRYVNTWCGVVTQDPDTGVHNVGTYRGIVLGPDRIGVLMVSSQGWGQHFFKYASRGEPCPVAVVYGYDPSLGFCAGTQIPTLLSEYAVMGAIRGQRVPLVKCETSSLTVPANAEIVVEGIVRFCEDPPEEGPFGEYTGYYSLDVMGRPVIDVKAITHRDDAIYRGSLEGAAPHQPNENSHMYAVTTKALMLEVFEKAGVPGVVDVRPGPVNYVKIRKQYQGHAKHVANALWGSYAAEWMWKMVVVVDEDIDIYNERNLQWALCYRVNPGPDDLVVMPDTRGGTLDPSTPKALRNEMQYGSGRWNRLLMDATRSLADATRNPTTGLWEWPIPSTLTHEGIMEKVEGRWEEYGINMGLPGNTGH